MFLIQYHIALAVDFECSWVSSLNVFLGSEFCDLSGAQNPKATSSAFFLANKKHLKEISKYSQLIGT